MEKKPIVGIIFGLIILIIGGLGVYSLDYLNNIYAAYLLIILGLLCLIEHIWKLLK